MIPYGRQSVSQDDIDAVTAVLRSDFLTQGPVVPRFEQAVADYCGAKHAIAANSATSVLHIACLALDVGPGDIVWTSPVTFVASANCALYCGAQVDFVDIDSRTYNMCPAALEKKLVAAEREGRLPKVVIPVHLTGQAADLDAIHRLARRFGFRVVEDASHAVGGRYRGKPVGDCEYSDIVVFSFHPVKVITSAEGGVALTNNPDLARRMARLRSHGITRDQAEMSKPSDGPWYYEQIELGYNYRMTELQAALGLSQMASLDKFVRRRHEIAARYDSALNSTHVTKPWQHPDNYSGYHLYVIRVLDEGDGLPHRAIFEELRRAGIGVNLHYIPVYRQPYYSRMGFDAKEFPEAERYYSEAISLPLFPTLSVSDQDKVIDQVNQLTKS